MKAVGRWEPRLLTMCNKLNCETTSQHCLTLFKGNSNRWNMVLVGFTRRTCSKEGEDCCIARKGDGYGFWTHKVWSSSTTWKRAKRSHGSTSRIIWQIWRLMAEKTTHQPVELGYTLLPQPPYSPGFTLCYFSKLEGLASRAEIWVEWRIIAATETYITDLKKICFSGGLMKLEIRWVKSIALKGDYVENQIAFFQKICFFYL